MKILKYAGMVAVILLGIAGCTKNPSRPEYEKDIVIYGYLWGGQSLSQEHAILVAYTQPLDQFYALENAGISNAVVTLTNETTSELFNLDDTEDKPGFYFNDAVRIQPKTTYTLVVDVDGKTVTAATTIPSELLLTTQLSPDTVNDVLQKNLGYEKPIIVQVEDEDPLIMVEMYCNEPYQNAEYISTFASDDHKYPSDQDEYDGGRNAEPRHISALVPYKDLLAPEFGNEHVIYWYASMIVFYGSSTLSVFAVDDNYHHYLTAEHPLYSGGIVGGIGVFGSMCGQKYELNVLKTD